MQQPMTSQINATNTIYLFEPNNDLAKSFFMENEELTKAQPGGGSSQHQQNQASARYCSAPINPRTRGTIKLKPHFQTVATNKKILPQPGRDMTALPPTFVPGPHDVICARGRKAKEHSGNILYRQMIKDSIDEYSSATVKHQKSRVVSDIVDFFLERGEGGFVKKQSCGTWYVVGEQLAREKTGQAFREQLSHCYSSSTKAKRQRWKRQKMGVRGVGKAEQPDGVTSSWCSDYHKSNTSQKKLDESVERAIMTCSTRKTTVTDSLSRAYSEKKGGQETNADGGGSLFSDDTKVFEAILRNLDSVDDMDDLEPYPVHDICKSTMNDGDMHLIHPVPVRSSSSSMFPSL